MFLKAIGIALAALGVASVAAQDEYCLYACEINTSGQYYNCMC